MNIEIEKQEEGRFIVTVSEGHSKSEHLVTIKPDYYQTLTGGHATEEELVRKSFEFLLEREPKEAILGQFEIGLIARYFPEYESEIKKRL